MANTKLKVEDDPLLFECLGMLNKNKKFRKDNVLYTRKGVLRAKYKKHVDTLSITNVTVNKTAPFHTADALD